MQQQVELQLKTKKILLRINDQTLFEKKTLYSQLFKQLKRHLNITLLQK